jgi:hypothetical protein
MDNLQTKLQIKADQKIAVVDQPNNISLPFKTVALDNANVILMFTQNQEYLSNNIDLIIKSAKENLLLWVAYPKANQLSTNINRDSVRAYVAKFQLDTVRLVSINDVWSALRLKVAL